jgi:hypothetical protein
MRQIPEPRTPQAVRDSLFLRSDSLEGALPQGETQHIASDLGNVSRSRAQCVSYSTRTDGTYNCHKDRLSSHHIRVLASQYLLTEVSNT